MNNIEQKDTILLVGDHHGQWDRLFEKINYYKINNCVLIHVGDGGEGFKIKKKQLREFDLLNNLFKKHNIRYWSIRGNHSDPFYFNGNIKLSNFELLDDYTVRELNGEKFLFVGGAVSIDRLYRREGLSYWRDETFVLDESKIQECDVLITHSAPSWVGPFDKQGISSWCEKDPTLWDECLTERKDHDTLLKLSKPKRSYHGHFHLYSQVEHNGTVATILDELQIIEHRNHKTLN
jgi:UDP-2,3-diacylglucosamine pyrophosphatase LpxH